MSKKKEKRSSSMFSFLWNSVDKAFFHVYEGEPLKQKRAATTTDSVLEEEVLFCKNNVCVHTIGTDNTEQHSPGYLCVKKVYHANSEISDLMLSWVPNTLLRCSVAETAQDVSQPGSDKIEEKTQEQQLDINTTNNIDNNDQQLTKNFETPLGQVFSVNILEMKTVKLFYVDAGKDDGQFVVGSHENEYKVFHFHQAGLVKLSHIFDDWNGCNTDARSDEDESMQRVFNICVGCDNVTEDGRSVHPEEGRFKPLNSYTWLSCVNQNGQIEDVHNFRKHVFFGGLSQEVRPDAWKFLLYYYPMHSTSVERDKQKENRAKLYEAIHQKRLALSDDPEKYQEFWRSVQFTVDKDVVRTDRSHPYYAGQDNPNIQKMRNILLNYAIHNPVMGYTQGMSDLVAPLLATLHDEVDAFWCFVGLMESSMFATTPTDNSMDLSLGYLRELLRVCLPEFYMHCLCQDYDLDLLFAHRWLVLCFKREFLYAEVLNIWESCWSRYQTDYFHIFICVALVSLYGGVCVERKMNSDEILQYFTDMALKFDGSTTLNEARYLLYRFRQMHRIPCTLRGLLSSGRGVWDGGIAPTVECISHRKKCCRSDSKDDSTSGTAKGIEKNVSEKNGLVESEDVQPESTNEMPDEACENKDNFSFNRSRSEEEVTTPSSGLNHIEKLKEHSVDINEETEKLKKESLSDEINRCNDDELKTVVELSNSSNVSTDELKAAEPSNNSNVFTDELKAAEPTTSVEIESLSPVSPHPDILRS